MLIFWIFAFGIHAAGSGLLVGYNAVARVYTTTVARTTQMEDRISIFIMSVTSMRANDKRKIDRFFLRWRAGRMCNCASLECDGDCATV